MTSIRKRVVVVTGIAVGVALVVSGVLVYVLAKRALVAQFDDALAAKAKALAMLVEQDGDVIEVDDVSRDAPPGEHFEIWDGGGRSLVRSKNAMPAARRSVMLEFAPRSEELESAGASVRPRATIVYARETRELDATIGTLATITFVVGLAALVFGVGLVAAVARYALRPLHVLGEDISAVRADELARVSRERPGELVPIVDRLNDLLARVETVRSRERAMTAEVAHELRTPVAGLRATIELALDRERSNERYRDALEQCLAITLQTERMVESMLSLAKLDAGVVPVDREAVELDALVRDVLASHAARISERGLAVATELEAATVETDRAKLATVVHNLVDNAISYANERGTIGVEVKGSTIEVTNSGCTLAAGDIARVFDRFWRGDAAREAGTHAGLGLSICKTLVELLGGGITATVRGGTFVATIVLPDGQCTLPDAASRNLSSPATAPLGR